MGVKRYVGKGRTLGQFGNIKIGVKLEYLIANDKGYVNMIIAMMKQPDKYGNTHTVFIDEYMKVEQEEQEEQREQEGLPF